MNRRFGDHTLPETHRRELQQIRKAAGESFQEYSTRIEAKMSKAYPGMQNTEIYKNLTLSTCLMEYMINQLLTMSLQNVHIPYRRLSICCPGFFYAKMESRPNSTSDKQQWNRNQVLQKSKEWKIRGKSSSLRTV